MTKLAIMLDSLQEAMDPIGKRCPDCEEFGELGLHDGLINRIVRDGKHVTYHCSSRFMPHEVAIARVNFEISEDELLEAAKELKDYVCMSDKNTDWKNCSSFKLENFKKRRDKLTTKLRNYAQFIPKGKEVEVPGNCYYCLDEVPITLKDWRVRYSCSPCAMIVADGAD